MTRRIANRAFTIVELMGAIMILLVLAALLLSGLGHAREIARGSLCSTTLRNLHVALSTYAIDNNNCFPPTVTNGIYWPSKISKYLSRPITKTESDTYCPVTSTTKSGDFQRDRAGWRTDYNVNGFVFTNTEGDNRLAAISGKLVMLYDGGGGGSRLSAADSIFTARHAERFNVIFVDGHLVTLKTFDDYTDAWKRQ